MLKCLVLSGFLIVRDTFFLRFSFSETDKVQNGSPLISIKEKHRKEEVGNLSSFPPFLHNILI